jgi:phage shock protein A
MNTTNDQPAADSTALRTLADNQAEDIERLRAKIAALETQLEAHAWTISPAMAQAQIDALNAKIAELEKDKARLDWIEANADQIHCSESVAGNIEQYWVAPTRAAIDAEMEGTP